MHVLMAVIGAVALTASPTFAQAPDIPADYQAVMSALGKKGDFKDGVLTVNIPRGDLTVTIAERAAPTPFGFGGWVALTKGTGGADVLMGDLVLTEDEVNPVCPHGAAKSVLASAYFQRVAKERGLNVRVDSAGTDPDPEVGKAVAAHLTKTGYALPIDKPRRATASDVEQADVMVSLGCDLAGLPQPRGKLLKWDDVAGPSENFPGADDAIRKHVENSSSNCFVIDAKILTPRRAGTRSAPRARSNRPATGGSAGWPMALVSPLSRLRRNADVSVVFDRMIGFRDH
jgi:hypothetical protein